MQLSPENLYNRIRDLILDGDTSMALQELQTILESDPKYHSLLSWHTLISAKYNRIEKEARRGLITEDKLDVSRNQTNDQLHQIIKQLREGNLDVEGSKLEPDLKPGTNRKWLIPVLALLVFGLAGFASWRFFLNGNNKVDACPGFADESQFNVMLFPFREVGGGKDLNPEISIMDRLDQLCNQNGIKSSIRIHGKQDESLDFQTASAEGDKCNASLVIWGTVEEHANVMDLTTRYKYLGNAEGLEVTKLQLEGESQVDTTTSISSIVREGVLTKNIEELILTIFGLIAHEEEQYDVAIDALEKAGRQDTSGAILTGVLLADAYLAINNTQKAVEAYDKVLQVHPEYVLALNNKAALLFMAGNFTEASNDYSRIIQLDPKNTDALIGRIAANTKLDREEAVQADMEVLRRLSPGRLRTLRSTLQNQKPKFFIEAENFLSVLASKSFTFPASDASKAVTLVISGIIPDGKSSSSHVITIQAPKAYYYTRFRVTNQLKLSKTVTSSTGKKTELGPNDVSKKLYLPRDQYTLEMQRTGTSGNLYYEVEMTIEAGSGSATLIYE
ncbi:MAG: hypothetical protein KDC34_08975 [Saprospiraceae bacterium]|nr:hypothetical protein [Saprospiraceae bacterium]